MKFHSFSMVALLFIRSNAFQMRRLSVPSWFRPRSLAASSESLQGMFDSLSAIPNVKASTKDPWSCKSLLQCIKHMDKVELKDLSLVGYPIKKTSCMNIVETPNFQIAAFILPKDRILPVHDHPGMTVLSKVLSGDLRVTSFTANSKINTHTTTTNTNAQTKSPIEVCLQEHSVRTQLDAPWMISPSVGNFHEFTALSDCVILDVLLPPYTLPERPCTYYTATPASVDESTVNSHRVGVDKSDSDTTSGTDTTIISTTTDNNRPRWLLHRVSEIEAHRQYGLPSGVHYPGYIPVTTHT